MKNPSKKNSLSIVTWIEFANIAKVYDLYGLLSPCPPNNASTFS